MADEQTRSGRRDESASVSDADFTVESASASNAIEAPPDDTTVGHATAAAPVEAATTEVEDHATDETEIVEEKPDESHASASRATVQAKPAGQPPKLKGKGKVSLEKDRKSVV